MKAIPSSAVTTRQTLQKRCTVAMLQQYPFNAVFRASWIDAYVAATPLQRSHTEVK